MARKKSPLRLLLEELKSVPCHDCGKTFPNECMSFDHRDPGQKLGPVGSFVRAGDREGLLAEIAKCDVVCLNCHATRTRQVMPALKREKHAAKMQSPETRKKIGAATKEKWKDPDFARRVSEGHAEGMKRWHAQHKAEGGNYDYLKPSEEAKASLSRSARDHWADPVQRELHSQGIREMWATKVQSEEFNSEHARALRRERAKKSWETRRKDVS